MIDTDLTWSDVLSDEKKRDYFQSVMAFVASERAQGKNIYPLKSDVFNAFKLTPFHNIKVVILGQDPYHQPNQAHGLAFSVRETVRIPPSLQNIYKEISSDLSLPMPGHGNLNEWAQQGVFLLNTVLSVEQGKAHSHAGKGWERFTDHVIKTINEHHKYVVYMLWGANAHKKVPLINAEDNLILKSPHPSPLSAHRGFLGSRQFSQCNHYLNNHGIAPVDWSIR